MQGQRKYNPFNINYGINMIYANHNAFHKINCFDYQKLFLRTTLELCWVAS